MKSKMICLFCPYFFLQTSKFFGKWQNRNFCALLSNAYWKISYWNYEIASISFQIYLHFRQKYFSSVWVLANGPRKMRHEQITYILSTSTNLHFQQFSTTQSERFGAILWSIWKSRNLRLWQQVQEITTMF